MKTIQISTESITIKTNWNELDRHQLLALSNLSLKRLSHKETAIVALVYLMGFKVRKIREKVVGGVPCFYLRSAKGIDHLVSTVDLLFLIKLMDFLFLITEEEEKNEGNGEYNSTRSRYQWQSRLFRQLFPKIWVSSRLLSKKLLYGPADGLTNIKLSEFIQCETYYSDFLKTKDESKANLLIATLYRPEREGYDPANVEHAGDRREPLNDYLVKKRVKLVNRLKPHEKQAILFYYEGCKLYLKGKFPNVFEEGEHSDNKSERANKIGVFEGYIKLVASLADNEAPKIEAWMDTQLYAVLITMENERIEQKRLKELYNKK
ncbi:MAG: hypothetical protein WCL06_09735 [Bacteroidota bacterium]